VPCRNFSATRFPVIPEGPAAAGRHNRRQYQKRDPLLSLRLKNWSKTPLIYPGYMKILLFMVLPHPEYQNEPGVNWELVGAGQIFLTGEGIHFILTYQYRYNANKK
jgi:hypothetical protein